MYKLKLDIYKIFLKKIKRKIYMYVLVGYKHNKNSHKHIPDNLASIDEIK